jgi:hypothetical protein
VTSGPAAAVSAKHAARALLGYAMECLLAGLPAPAGTLVPGPWDAWWACYRAGLPLGRLAAGTRARRTACASCAERASLLAAADPPQHPGAVGCPGGCLLSWAAAMRSPGTPVTWPDSALSLALLKPGAPANWIAAHLQDAFEVLGESGRPLTPADTRQLYPEAYGAEFVKERDAYLTSGPVRILILRARSGGTQPGAVKRQIRAGAGAGSLRNHVHMPDSPGDAFADIAHFAGYDQLRLLYGRHDRDGTAGRLAFYRAALGIGDPGADRRPPAG